MRIATVQDMYRQFPDIDGFWGYETLNETELAIRNALDLHQADENKLKRVEILTQLARVLNIQEKTVEATATLKKAQDLLNSSTESTDRMRSEIRLLLEQGRHLWLARNPARAQVFLNQAWTLATTFEEKIFAIDAAYMLAITQPPKFQNEWLTKALDLSKKSTDPQTKLWLPLLYLFKGWLLFDFRRFDEALVSFNKALEHSSQDTATVVRTLTIRWSIARTLRSLNKIHEALDIQNSLQFEFNKLNKVNGYVLLEIAECLQLLQKIEEAKGFYELAYKELSLNGWYLDNHKSELNRMQFLYKLR